MNNTSKTIEAKNETSTNEKKIWKGRKPNPEYLAMKKCKTCGELKNLDEFHTNSSMHDGRLHQCKSCQSADVREYHNTSKGRDVLHKATKKYSQTPKGKYVLVKSAHKARGGGKIIMTEEEFADLMENSKECAICGAVFDKNIKPYTDHILAIKNKEGKPSPLSIENIQLLCWECSGSKCNKTLTAEDILKMKIKRFNKLEN